ncbi:hypothetical protein AUJ22_01905 [Candidatus Nomurabacteria bacterium CG1_02_31_12]|uniref:Uncharacterized protein n=2 Tax=Candidatus Nomuraibacteriota TaxID=1752729 RepID=A0A1J4V1K6_9BACT|nr:MAG: hypothetical protein AUJ22_01905 [Candidatus Nomurabacteria bacterium CG1_02_31_12]
MQNKKIQNSIISFMLIVSTILMPLSFIPKKVEAQSVSGYASGLAPMIATLPQCKEVINNGVKNLFNGISGLFSSDSSDSGGGTLGNMMSKKTQKGLLDQQWQIDHPSKLLFFESNENSLKSVSDSAANSFDNIQVFDTEANKKLDSLQKDSQEIKQSTESINTNSTCIQSIGRLIIKMLLQKLTISTVTWINNGFDGKPAFLQDPGKFFKDIARTEILQFGAEINDPKLFPFGKVWMKNTAAAFNNKFQDNAQYSLDKEIQKYDPKSSAETFREDFSQGGWNAWTAMTQSPANNPIGFKIIADNEIQKRLAGTTQSTAEQVHEALSQANGFLGDERCVDPPGITKTQEDAAWRETPSRKICNKHEYVTPGKMISDKATEVLGYQNNAYLNVEDLNDAVAAITDALLGQFSQYIYNKGFANIGTEGSDGTLIFDTSYSTGEYRSQTEKDFTPSQLSNSWLQANPDFDIRTDLTQALIDEQRTYSDKLKIQNRELISTTDNGDYKLNDDIKSSTYGQSNAYGLIPTIYQLDYCIPGPHPGWEDDSRRVLAAATNAILPETAESLKDLESEQVIDMVKAVGGTAAGLVAMSVLAAPAAALIGVAVGSSLFPVVGTVVGALVGFVVGFLIDLFAGDDPGLNVRTYYSGVIASFSGYLPDYGNENDARIPYISSKTGTVSVLNSMLDRYAIIMGKTYFSDPELLPTVRGEAIKNFEQLTGYAQMSKNNEDKIYSLKTTINILGEIKEKVDILNNKLEYSEANNGTYTKEDFENELKEQINAFARVSSDMVNGNDIFNVDDLTKQIIDKRNDIYVHLLKGPSGCEVEIEANSLKPADKQKKFMSAANKICPAGFSGAYPICTATKIDICPAGWTGTYPTCTATKKTCPAGWIGTYPDCSDTTGSGSCQTNWTGTYPTCKAPIERTSCPTGWEGTYPTCTAIKKACPDGYQELTELTLDGIYPTCLDRSNGGVYNEKGNWNNFDGNSIKRATYPFPILYDYNLLINNKIFDIPDPLNENETGAKVYNNKIPANYGSAGGPGFLNFIYFSSENQPGKGNNRRGAERLHIEDLVPQSQDDISSRDRSIGDIFEKMIGIY